MECKLTWTFTVIYPAHQVSPCLIGEPDSSKAEDKSHLLQPTFHYCCSGEQVLASTRPQSFQPSLFPMWYLFSSVAHTQRRFSHLVRCSYYSQLCSMVIIRHLPFDSRSFPFGFRICSHYQVVLLLDMLPSPETLPVVSSLWLFLSFDLFCCCRKKGVFFLAT